MCNGTAERSFAKSSVFRVWSCPSWIYVRRKRCSLRLLVIVVNYCPSRVLETLGRDKKVVQVVRSSLSFTRDCAFVVPHLSEYRREFMRRLTCALSDAMLPVSRIYEGGGWLTTDPASRPPVLHILSRAHLAICLCEHHAQLQLLTNSRKAKERRKIIYGFLSFAPKV